MQHVDIIAVGSLSTEYRAPCAEYSKRLGAYCKLTVHEIAEHRLPKNPSEAQIAKGLEAEGAAILTRLPARCFVAALCIEGKPLESQAFAKRLAALRGEHSHIAFVIGGSHGLSRLVKDTAAWRLSLSRMTFPHQLARVMLLEQLFRAFSISAGGKYHK